MGKVPLWGHFFAGWQAKVRPPMMSGGPWLGLKDTSGVLLPGKTEYSLPLRGTGADCHPLEQHGPKMPRAQWRKTLDGSRGSARPFRSPRTVNLTHRAGAHHFGRTTLELPRSRSHPGQGRSEESRPKPPRKVGVEHVGRCDTEAPSQVHSHGDSSPFLSGPAPATSAETEKQVELVHPWPSPIPGATSTNEINTYKSQLDEAAAVRAKARLNPPGTADIVSSPDFFLWSIGAGVLIVALGSGVPAVLPPNLSQ